jgi:CubicO group peptidase (beta-lactamase class C family)
MKDIRKNLIMLYIAFTLVSSVTAQQTSNNFLIKHPEVASNIKILESWIEAQMEYRNLPGISIGIVYDQELIWKKGFGFSNIQSKIPTAPNTLYRIASISKLFTSIAIMKLYDEGRIKLDTPINHFLPWFKINNIYPNTPQITIRHLLTHTSGIPSDSQFPYWSDFNFPEKDQIINKLSQQELVLPPESKFKYSNLGFALAGIIVEKISEESYSDYIKRNILDPLGMNDTYAVLPDKIKSNLSTGYGRRMPDGNRRIMPYSDTKGITSAAGVSTTVEDLARFASWNFRLFRSDSIDILKPSTFKKMIRVQWLDQSWLWGWGLGYAIYHNKERDIIGHSGLLGGYSSAFYLSMNEKVAIIVLTNAVYRNIYPGSPYSIIDKAFEWIAPAIVKASKSLAKVKKTNPQWYAYTGKYRSWWADIQIIITNGELSLIYPNAIDPKAQMVKLVPISRHVFRIEGDGFDETGEKIKFEMGTDGKVVRLIMANQYFEPVSQK